MGLNERLRAFRAEFEARTTPAAVAVMHRATDDPIAVYQNFGVDLPRFDGDDSWRLPMPARYVIDHDGIVRWAEVDPDYTVRPEPETMLEALRGLEGG